MSVRQLKCECCGQVVEHLCCDVCNETRLLDDASVRKQADGTWWTATFDVGQKPAHACGPVCLERLVHKFADRASKFVRGVLLSS